MKNKNTQFLFHLAPKSNFYQTHWYPLLNQTATPEPTPTPDVFEESELERVESQNFDTEQAARNFLLQNVDEAEARLRDKFGNSLRSYFTSLEIETEAEQQINLQFDSLRRLIEKEFPDTNTTLSENKKNLIREISQQLIEAIGGQKLKDPTTTAARETTPGITTIDKQSTLGVVPKELVPTFHALQPLFKIIDDAGLDWSGADYLGESKIETYLKDQLMQLFEKNPEFVSLVSNMSSQEKESLNDIVNRWIDKQQTQNESWTDDRVDIHHADDLVIIIEIYLTGLATQTRLEKEGKDKDAVIAAQTARADVAEEERDTLIYEEERQRLFNTFVKPYQGPTKGENQYLELTFNDEDSVYSVNILTTPVVLEGDNTLETITIESRDWDDFTVAKDIVVAFLKEQLPEKFQEQKDARQFLIEKFGAVQIRGETINDRLTAIDAQLTTLADYLNEEDLISTLATINSSIIKVFTQLDAMAAVPENATATAPQGLTPEVRVEATDGETPGAGRKTAAAGQAAGSTSEGVPLAGGETPEAGTVAGTVAAPETAAPAAEGTAAVPTSRAVQPAAPAESTRGERPAVARERTTGDPIQPAWSSAAVGEDPVEQEETRIVKQVTPHLNVRDDNGNKKPEKLKPGDEVTVLPEKLKKVGDFNFVKVRYDGNKEGWVAFEYLKKKVEEPAPAPTEPPTTGEKLAPPAPPAAHAEVPPPAAPATRPAAAEKQPAAPTPPAVPAPPPESEQAYINLPIHRADSKDYLKQSTIQDFLNRSYKKKGERSYQDDRSCRKELDRLYDQVIEPLSGTYKPSNPSEKAEVALMRLNQTLSMGAFREERGEHPLEKAGESVRDRTVAPAKEIAQAAFENIIGHTTAETLSHAAHLRLGEAARSFGGGLLGAGKNIISAPIQLLFNKDPFEEGYPELRQARKEAVKLLQDHLKEKFPGVRGSEWERAKDEKISELKGSGKEGIYNELESMYANLGKHYQDIAVFNFNDKKVQDAKVEQLIKVMATWGVSNVLSGKA